MGGLGRIPIEDTLKALHEGTLEEIWIRTVS